MLCDECELEQATDMLVTEDGQKINMCDRCYEADYCSLHQDSYRNCSCND